MILFYDSIHQMSKGWRTRAKESFHFPPKIHLLSSWITFRLLRKTNGHCRFWIPIISFTFSTLQKPSLMPSVTFVLSPLWDLFILPSPKECLFLARFPLLAVLLSEITLSHFDGLIRWTLKEGINSSWGFLPSPLQMIISAWRRTPAVVRTASFHSWLHAMITPFCSLVPTPAQGAPISPPTLPLLCQS